MTPLGHASLAFLAGVTMSKAFPTINSNLIVTATTLGGIAVDLDLFVRFYQKGSQVFDKTIGKHRFFPSHTPLFTFIASLSLAMFNFYFGLFFFVGTLIHLFLDTLFFPEGINFLYPFNKNMHRFLTIKTHPFWAPKRISGVEGWHKNYLTSPIFWVSEVFPLFLSIVILLLQ